MRLRTALHASRIYLAKSIMVSPHDGRMALLMSCRVNTKVALQHTIYTPHFLDAIAPQLPAHKVLLPPKSNNGRADWTLQIVDLDRHMRPVFTRQVLRPHLRLSLSSSIKKPIYQSSVATMANIHTPIPKLKLNDGNRIPMV